MKTKTKVEIKTSMYCDEMGVGNVGYVDGYVQGVNSAPYVCVVVKEKIILCYMSALRVISEEEYNERIKYQ